jgi:acyl-CoA thioester hydrolase
MTTTTGRSLGKPGDTIHVDFRVRYAECDAMGLLHHARYWEYFEHARTELLRQQGFRYRDLEADGVLFVVYKADIKYLAPIRYDDLVTVTTTVARITRTRVDHAYEIHRGNEKTTEGSSTLACVGRDGRPIMMPEALWSESKTQNQNSKSAGDGLVTG